MRCGPRTLRRSASRWAGSAAGHIESRLALEPVAAGLDDPVHVAVARCELYVAAMDGRVWRLVAR